MHSIEIGINCMRTFSQIWCNEETHVRKLSKTSGLDNTRVKQREEDVSRRAADVDIIS